MGNGWQWSTIWLLFHWATSLHISYALDNRYGTSFPRAYHEVQQVPTRETNAISEHMRIPADGSRVLIIEKEQGSVTGVGATHF